MSVARGSSADELVGTLPADIFGGKERDGGSAAPSSGRRKAVRRNSAAWRQIGLASWYGAEHQGKRTASGARFDMNALTAAHRSLPLGTMLLVENLANRRTILVRVNDRGPFVGARIIDLSQEAARRIGLKESGTGRVALSIAAAE
ncbi:MAG TPA: septal ring lytic transglycosylase RlpA family protein [Stellaceae bacterium]|nr:septal ring lytic transglycosylase RlpA family protein [Stellaceae bacterium]